MPFSGITSLSLYRGQVGRTLFDGVFNSFLTAPPAKILDEPEDTPGPDGRLDQRLLVRASRLLPFGLGSGRLGTVRSADSVSIVLVLTLLMEKSRQAARVNATEDEFAFRFMLRYRNSP
ncbi:hypothetical protein AHAS_Ahas04G0124200 [Arachis hypogaea]